MGGPGQRSREGELRKNEGGGEVGGGAGRQDKRWAAQERGRENLIGRDPPPSPQTSNFSWEEKKKGEGGQLRRVARSSGMQGTDRTVIKKEA